MKHGLTTIQYEFRHLIRSPYKIMALILFTGALVYGLQNGKRLLHKQQTELEVIRAQNKETLALVNNWYDKGIKGPAEKPWIDISSATWAIWYAPATVTKKPSPLIAFSIGQAEQFGYYKQVINWSSVFDPDLAEEIANPERLTLGTLDFSFVVLYLLPVLAIVLLFNIGGLERDLGFDKLLMVNNTAPGIWLPARFTFYFVLLMITLLLPMLVYAVLTGAWPALPAACVKLYLLFAFYMLIWFVAFYFINRKGKGSAGQAIKMVTLWLLFCIVVPGTVHQLSSFKYPADYMTDYADVSRDQQYKLLEGPTDSIRKQIMDIYPGLLETAYAKDTIADENIIGNSVEGIINYKVKQAAEQIETEKESRNQFIRSTYWINPVSFFQNTVNALCGVDYYAYKQYQTEIQTMIDKKMDLLLKESWERKIASKWQFQEYVKTFNSNP